MSIEQCFQCECDKVTVHDGPDASYPVLATICGISEHFGPFESNGRYLFVHFTSDFQTELQGFTFSWTNYVATTPTKETTVALTTTTPQTVFHIYDYKGVIEHPVDRKNGTQYGNNEDIYWIIDHSRYYPGGRIRLYFEEVDIETSANCRYDYVQLRDGPYEYSSNITAPVCGKWEDGLNNHLGYYYSTGSQVLVYFHSREAHTFTGFELHFEWIPSDQTTQPATTTKGTNPIFTTTAGVVTTKGMETTTHAATTTAGVVTTKGMETTTHAATTAMPGPKYEYLTGYSGYIEHPKGRNNGTYYKPNEEIIWLVNHTWTNPGGRIKFYFMEMDIESGSHCQYDYVQLFNGEFKYGNNFTERLCGHSTPSESFYSSGSVASVYFRSDPVDEFTGFKLFYIWEHLEMPSTTPKAPEIHYLYEPSGIIEHPIGRDNGTLYGPDENIYWVVDLRHRLPSGFIQ